MCNACGFCKYAKFEYTLTSRPCCAVDPIENEDDRKKAILSINSLLDKADRVYRQLIGNKPILESLLLKVIYLGVLTTVWVRGTKDLGSLGQQVLVFFFLFNPRIRA